MIWILTILTFLATAGVVVAIVYAFSPAEVSVATRLARLAGLAGPAKEEAKFADRKRAGSRHPGQRGQDDAYSGTEKASRTQLLMFRAGYRSSEALLAMARSKAAISDRRAWRHIFLRPIPYQRVFPDRDICGRVSFADMWLTWRVSVRQRKLRKALPDALDCW